MDNNMLRNLWQWGVVSRKPTICTRGRQRAEENGFRELSVFSSLYNENIAKGTTDPTH